MSERTGSQTGRDGGGLRDAIVGERVLYEGRAYDFVELELRQPDGTTRPRPIVRHRGAVVVVPLLEQPGRPPKVVTVVNDRHTLNGRLDELPAGGIEPGEIPMDAAHRELAEETGMQAASMYELGSFYTTPGMTDELMHAFVATSLIRGEQQLEEDESLEVKVRSVSELFDMMDRGALTDGKSMLALLLAQRKGYLD